MGKGAKPTIGFRFFFKLHIGLGRGPLDEIVEIEADHKKVWQGSITDNATIQINKPNLFGGDKGEGGIQGKLDVLMGAPTQAPLSWLAKIHGPLLPAFRGVCTLAYDGLICSFTKSPKPWKVRGRRAVKGWENDDCWYPEKAVISLADGAIKAMNPAHIVLQVTTDRRVGRGLDRAFIDLGSFKAAADALSAEGFGLCLKWARSSDVNEFLQVVCDHVGAVIDPDYETGLLTFSLIRNDYVLSDLPLFTPDTGLLGIDDEDSAARAGAVNQIAVTYRDPITDTDGSVRVSDPGGVQSAGRVISEKKEYPGIPTSGLAARVAQRDLAIGGSGLKRYKVRLDRRGFRLRPGKPFRVSDPANGIGEVVLRAGTRDGGTLTDGTITIACVQDVFSLPATSWVGSQPSTHAPPDTEPRPAPDQAAFELSYRDLVRNLSPGDLAAQDEALGYVGAVGARPAGFTYNFELATSADGAPYDLRGGGDWTPSAALAESIDGQVTAVQFTSAQDLDQVVLGGLVLVGEECCRLDALNLGAGTAVLGRGCIDTVPAPHEAGVRVWFVGDTGAADPTEYLAGESVSAKLLTRTSRGLLDVATAPSSTVVVGRRQTRPYPPAHVTVNGESLPSVVEGAVAVAWRYRDRLLQADALVDQEAGSIGPEPGTTYLVRLLTAGGSVLYTSSMMTTSSHTFSVAYAGFVRLEVASERGGINGWQKQVRDFYYNNSAEPVLGLRSAEAGAIRVSESGIERITEE